MKDHTDTGTLEWLGVTYKTILSTAETGGAMSIVDSVSPPRSGPPRHVHEAEDEVFVVLSGEVKFWIDGETILKGPGEAAFVPRGTEHTFQIVSDHPSRHLVILTPGGFEGFFADMAKGRFQIPGDMEAIVECGARHNLRFTGLPLGEED